MSLVVIIIMNMFGIFVKTTMNFVFNTFWKVDIFFKTEYFLLMTFVTIAVYSANAPVLYIFR
jgi:hypothetical protein